MKSFQVFSLITLATLISVSCSNRGLQNLGGRQCLAEAPFPKEMAKGQTKVWGKESAESAIPAGQYDYHRGDMYYVDKKTGVAIQVHEEPDKSGKLISSIYCVRGAEKADIRQITPVSVQGAAKMNLAAKTVNTRILGFEVIDGSLKAKIVDGAMVDSLEKAYAGKASDYFMFNHSADKADYFIRSYGDDANGSYQMQMWFKKP